MTHPGTWRLLKWGGMSGIVVLLAVWLAGIFVSVYYSGYSWGCAVIECGGVRIYRSTGTSGGGWLVYPHDPPIGFALVGMA